MSLYSESTVPGDEMDESNSDVESRIEEEIPDLADIYTSSSYTPSSDDYLYSDSDTSLKGRDTKNTSGRETSDSNTIESTSVAGSDLSSTGCVSLNQESIPESNSENGTGSSVAEVEFQGTIRMYLDEVRSIKSSNNAKIEFREFAKRLMKEYTEFTREQKKKLKNLDIMMEDVDDNDESRRKRTAFSPEEIETIIQNWNSFCEDYRFDPQNDWKMFLPHLPFIKTLSREQKDMFKHYISQYLPYRRRHEVFMKFADIYHRSGRLHEKFTPDEDELLITCREMKESVRTIRDILSLILKRPTSLLQQREDILKLREGNCSAGDELQVRNTVKNPSCAYEEDILNRPNDEYPEWTRDEEVWKELAKSEGQYSVKELKKAYFRGLYPSVRAMEGVSSTRLESLLVRWLSVYKELTWENVDWKRAGRRCRKVGAVKAYSVVRKLTKKHVPKEQWHDLEAAVATLRTKLNIPPMTKRRLTEIERKKRSEDSQLRSRRKQVRLEYGSKSLRLRSAPFVATDSDSDDPGSGSSLKPTSISES